jgi:hypothetical protein
VSRNYFPIISFALAALVAPLAHQAIAQGAPNADQLDAAKKAFGEGKAAHDAGKLPEAIEKFKESYRLSRNPVLLYNIALTLDENKQTDNALFYYRKFLSDAPADAAQRKAATERVKQLETEKLDADLSGKPAEKQGETPTKPVEAPIKKDIKIKPAGTYAASEFQHQVVEDAPPGKPLDISAFVPEDSGWTVTLYYRSAGDSTFVAKPMVWHYKQLIARIPAAKVTGSSIQYYVEAKDQAGTSVAKSGKATSPNLVNLDASVQPRFFPDFSDDSTADAKTPTQRLHHDDEDPLNKNKHTEEPIETAQPMKARWMRARPSSRSSSGAPRSVRPRSSASGLASTSSPATRRARSSMTPRPRTARARRRPARSMPTTRTSSRRVSATRRSRTSRSASASSARPSLVTSGTRTSRATSTPPVRPLAPATRRRR